MRDDPRQNLKWLEQELLAEDSVHRDFRKLPVPEYHEEEDLLELVDMLIGEDETEPEPRPRNFANQYGRDSKGIRAERAHQNRHLEEPAAVLTKTKKQIRQEKRQRTQAEKKSGVNRKLGDLVFLAILEVIGIMAILGWWIQ